MGSILLSFILPQLFRSIFCFFLSSLIDVCFIELSNYCYLYVLLVLVLRDIFSFLLFWVTGGVNTDNDTNSGPLSYSTKLFGGLVLTYLALWFLFSASISQTFWSLLHFLIWFSFENIQVAQFLRVNPEAGLFFFDSSYRPVPLAQQYIGISEQNFAARNELLNQICYKKVFAYHVQYLLYNLCWSKFYLINNFLFFQVVESLRQGHQAMVFVHSRKDTVKTAQKLVIFRTLCFCFKFVMLLGILNCNFSFAIFCLLRKRGFM